MQCNRETQEGWERKEMEGKWEEGHKQVPGTGKRCIGAEGGGGKE